MKKTVTPGRAASTSPHFLCFTRLLLVLAGALSCFSLRAQSPPQVGSGTPSTHALLVCQDGTVQGWGNNYYGELCSFTDPTTFPATLTGVGLTNIVSTAVGVNASFAIRQNGQLLQLLAWGRNQFGKLGIGSASASTATPTLVSAPGFPAIKAVAAGTLFTVALGTDGTVWTWGSNAAGQLGAGAGVANRSVPGQVTGFPAPVTAIEAGSSYALALCANGQVYSWGANGDGALGLGLAVGAIQYTPALITFPSPAAPITKIAAGFHNAMALGNGFVYTWGYNVHGSVGDGTYTNRSSPVVIWAAVGTVDIAATEYASCAIFPDGTTKMWGDNELGYFGTCYAQNNRNVPGPGPTFTPGVKIKGSGLMFTSVETNGVLKTWGWKPLGYISTTPDPWGNGSSCLPQTPVGSCAARPCPPLAVAGQSSICQGTQVTLTASGGDGILYRWTVNGTSLGYATASVTVAPTATTTYTVTSGCGAPATFQVYVETNCCARTAYTGPIHDIAPGTYDAGSNPFIFGPGAWYTVPGTLRLVDGTFTLEAGVTLLMAGGTGSHIELGAAAQLTLQGATITAACDEMWGGIQVEDGALGIKTQGGPGRDSYIQHSYEGIVLQEATDVPAAFQLEGTRFLHNRQSVEIHRFDILPTSADYIYSCTFDSDPQAFKAPWNYQTPEESYYSLRHIAVAGDVRPAAIAYNSFRHSLFGVYGLSGEKTASSVHLENNTFENFYIGGVFNGPIAKGDVFYELQGNTMTFPAEASLPNTYQVKNTVQEYNDDNITPSPGNDIYLEGTYGVYVYYPMLTAQGNRFQQLDSTTVLMDDYEKFATVRPRQTGIWTYRPAVVNSNVFYLLDTGINFIGVTQQTQYEVQGNGFIHCRLGINLEHLCWGQLIYPTTTPMPLAVVNLSCNTFRRNDERIGTSIGVHIAQKDVQDLSGHYNTSSPAPIFHPGVRLDNPAAPANTTYMKNWFDNSGVASGGVYRAIVNDQTGYTLDYKTFGIGSNIPGTMNYAQHDKDLTTGLKNIPTNGGWPNTIAGTETCQYQMPAYPNAGIQFRGAAGTGGTSTTPPPSGLAQNWPNPAKGTTSFAYQIKAGTQKAELLIRRATDGREMQRLTLDVRRTAQEVDLHGWPTGTYFATLLTDGLPGATRRVVVE